MSEYGSKIIQNLIENAYVENKGVHYFYDRKTKVKKGGINSNDLGDYIPFFHYYGFIKTSTNYIKTCLDKYHVFYRERVSRFGSTFLSRFGVIDLYSNSDYFQGLVFAKSKKEYSSFHTKIDFIFSNLNKILSKTNFTHFYKIRNHYMPLPLFRLLDIGMYPELLMQVGHKSLGYKINNNIANRIIKNNASLNEIYFYRWSLVNKSTLMKDHTNFLFSYLRCNRDNFSDEKLVLLKKVIDIVDNSFTHNNIIFNEIENVGKIASPLSFAFLEVLLEAFIESEDSYYINRLEQLLEYWLNLIEKYTILPGLINIQTNKVGMTSTVDPNTDFFVFLKKLKIFTGDKYISTNFINSYRDEIIKNYLNKNTFDVYKNVDVITGERHNSIKSKFACLFVKIFIVDQIKSIDDYYNKEIYLDDR